MVLMYNGSSTPTDGRGVTPPASAVPTGGVISTSAVPTVRVAPDILSPPWVTKMPGGNAARQALRSTAYG